MKEDQNIILEQKVNDKTLELATANNQLTLYAAQITELNKNLEGENVNLKEDVKIQIKARSEHELLGFDEFRKSFPTAGDCYEHIAKIKWANGFVCPKCQHTIYKETIKDEKLIIRRCVKCGNPDSVTTKTLFHHLKIDIVKAFYIAYVTSSKKQITIEALSNEIDLRQATTFTYIKKIKMAMDLKKKIKLHKDGWSHLIMCYVEE